MKARKLEEFDREQFTLEELAQLRAEAMDEVIELNLKALRNELGLTQAELAARLGMAQAQVSQIEGRGDFLISTMRRYVEALGGKLEVCAVFDGQRIKVEGM